jgi:hypothetical protein
MFIYPVYNHNWRNISKKGKGKGKVTPKQAYVALRGLAG